MKAFGKERANGIALDYLPSDATLRALTKEFKVEFAVTYTVGQNGKKGFYNLYVGNSNSVSLPVTEGEYLLKHTHPGGTVKPSGWDIDYLKSQEAINPKQKKSVILPEGKPKTTFNKNSEHTGYGK